jgi:hypothetical protein
MKRTVFFWLILWCLTPLVLFAQEKAFQFMPVSTAGSGGTHTAAEDGVYTLLGNPALLNAVNQSMFFAASFGIGDVYKNGTVETSVPPAYYRASGPFAIGAISKGVGYGFFNCFQFYENSLDAHFVGSAGIDWILINTPNLKLDFGLSPRLLLNYMREQPILLSAASITPGLLFSLGKRVVLGISYNDAGSVAYYMEKSDAKVTRIYSSLNIGIAASLISRAALSFTIYTDYRDLLGLIADDAGDPMRQLGVGARIDFRTYFWLLAGMFESSPTAGFGLNLGAIKLEASFFSNSVEAGIKIVRD